MANNSTVFFYRRHSYDRIALKYATKPKQIICISFSIDPAFWIVWVWIVIYERIQFLYIFQILNNSRDRDITATWPLLQVIIAYQMVQNQILQWITIEADVRFLLLLYVLRRNLEKALMRSLVLFKLLSVCIFDKNFHRKSRLIHD